ncbi:acylneuraminate cytidylyltransferase [Parasphingopyxis algicola]|nr:acylneuraminate cytidylyltransferase [Parasphingopyxis algicola]
MGATVAVIPARGGSKGIPGKNLAKVGGVPLVGRAVAAARAAARIDHVFVSSDDAAILACARKHGAGAIERPAEIAGDTASSESALLDALDRPEIQALDPERVVMIQCTSPFTRAEELDALVAALDREGVDCALTVAEDHGFLWIRDESETGVGVNHDHRAPRQRRQDLSPQYRETGAAYAMDVAAFRAAGTRFCGDPALVETAAAAPEIDTRRDLEVVRAIAAQIGAHPQKNLAKNIAALVTDFDGVHTDDRVIVDQAGHEAVRCSRSDGMGVERLREAGMPILILSKETNSVVARRAQKLRVPVLHGENDKLGTLRQWAKKQALTLDQICFVGNDVNDVACMQAVGLSVAPSDARPEAHRAADLVLRATGGNGAVREICEYLLLSFPAGKKSGEAR